MSALAAGLESFINVDSWIDIVDHIIVGLILIAVAAIPAIISARNHKGIRTITDQVVNGHDKPLRFDLDKLISAVDNISKSLAHLRQELFDEEHRRREGIRELRADMDRRFEDLEKKIV